MGISLEERDRRYRAIRELMAREELDSLLIAGRGDHMSRGNIRYITNYGIITGEQYCVFPSTGAPIFIARKTPFLAKLREAGWIPAFSETSNPQEQVKKELSNFDRGNKVGIVGMTDISVPMYLAVQAEFPDRVIDATYIFKQTRLIKSPEEIEKMQKSASIADKVFTTLRDMIRPGLSDYKIYGEVRRIIHEMGCEYSMELIDTETAKANLFYPTGDMLKTNGTLALEITPSYDGYYTQLAVSLPVGEYPPRIRGMIHVWKEALKAAVDILRPGVKVSDIYQIISNVIRDAGYSSLGQRYGHGIGLDVVDFWSLTESETMELKPGMTLALHPGMLLEHEEDGMGMGYTYLITDTGSKRLNKVEIVG
jgi:Xaa-Pro dipeptidase